MRSHRSLAALLSAVAALLSVLLFVSVPGHGLWYRVLINATHGPIFAAVAVLALLMHPPAARTSSAAYVTAFFVAVGFGVLVEVLQSAAGRPGSLVDVLTDVAGAAAGLALWATYVQRGTRGSLERSSARAWWLLAVALAGIVFVAWPPLQAARAYARRAADFPTIAAFRDPRDLTFLTTSGPAPGIVDLPAPWSRHRGERALRLGYDAQHWPAVQVAEPSPDWRGYAVIAVDITNPAATELHLVLRIFDATHDWTHEDRLNLPLVIAPRTRTTVRVALAEVEAAPAQRRMDLARIADVMLYGEPAAEPGVLYVSRVWLE